jgi:hypothetical protein
MDPHPDADPWQTMTYAPKYGAYEKTQNVYTAQMSCNALLGFGLPAADGKAFVDKLWASAIPNRNYWDGVLYMLGLLHVSGPVPPLVLTAASRSIGIAFAKNPVSASC